MVISIRPGTATLIQIQYVVQKIALIKMILIDRQIKNLGLQSTIHTPVEAIMYFIFQLGILWPLVLILFILEQEVEGLRSGIIILDNEELDNLLYCHERT